MSEGESGGYLLRLGGWKLAWSEAGECMVEIILTEVAEDGLVLASNLLVGAEDDEKEPCVAICDLGGMPLGCYGLRAVLLDGGADGGCGG